MPEIVGAAEYGGSFRVGEETRLPFVLPGEVLDQAVGAEAEESFAILKPSTDRVSPRCVHFGVCGGCQYQHAAYPAQLAIKRDLLASILQTGGAEPFPEITVHAAEPWGYRNRIRLRMESGAGSSAVGYNQRASNRFLPIRMCPIASGLLWRAAEAIRSYGEQDPEARRWLGCVQEMELFCTPAEDRLQAQFLIGRCQPKLLTQASFTAFCTSLHASLPELAGAGALMHPEQPRRARQAWAGVSWGRPGLLYPAADTQYWVSRGSFFQVNRFLVDRLVSLVTGARGGALAWDLYAGVGLFTLPLARTFQRVVAVEGSPAAAADLELLARAQPVVSARRQSTLDFLQAAVAQRDRPGLVVLDPPRAGLGLEAAALLARIAPPEIVYVSCDPTTLARDVAFFLRERYAIASVDLIDLFPQTFHLETVLVLRRDDHTQGNVV